MRKLMMATLALSAAALTDLAAPRPAMAYDFPWCLQGRGIGIPGECLYQTYEQCLDSASGRGLYCNINPRVAFTRPPRGQPPYEPAPYYAPRVHRY